MVQDDDETRRKAAKAELDSASLALVDLPPGPERDVAEARRDAASAALQRLTRGTSSNPIYTGGAGSD